MAAFRCPRVRWIPSSAAALLAIALPAPALACFFYEEPVDHSVLDQTAMEVVLVQRDGTTSMIVGAGTSGSVEDFGWIVAVPGNPNLEEAPENVFSSLDNATRPIFRVASGDGGSAYAADSGGGGCGGDAARAGSVLPEDQQVPQVVVWNTTVIGPYDIDVLTATSPADLRAWVENEGFPWRPETETDFQHYIDLQYFFVVARVRKESDEELVPVAMRYPAQGTDLALPMLLSRQAGVQDMGVLVWIVADQPARPVNWAQVAVPEDQIVVDVEEATTNYADLVANGVEAAPDHHGFVTEYIRDAASTSLLLNDEPTRDLVGDAGFVTRLYTRVDPDDIGVDPVFVLDPSVPQRDALRDLTLVEGSPYYGAAFRPVLGMSPIALVLLARLLRRRRG